MHPSFPKKYINELAFIYKQMDQAYLDAANAYDFHCNGCKDNCCYTRFFHHTYIEFQYLMHGFKQLSDNLQSEIIKAAEQVCEKTNEQLAENKSVRLMCPLNEDGKCILYDYRPLICRLHGVAHELTFPGQPTQYTPGCEAFSQHYKLLNLNDYHPLDRTPHYTRMGLLEKSYRTEFQINQRFKKTIAEMIVLSKTYFNDSSIGLAK